MLKKSIYGLVFLAIAFLAGYAGGRHGQNGVENVDIASHPLHYIPSNYTERVEKIEDVSIDIQNYPLSFVKASEKSTPAVVYIKTASNAPQRSFNDWFFGDIFSGRQDVVINSGSGVIVSDDGYIVTNNHVVEKAVKIEVILTNKQSFEATLVGTDPSSDLALLKIDAKGLKTINFANSNGIKVGEWVLAVGNPFNLTSTVTAGIVSAKGRNLNLLSNIFPIESFIQTDAAINPGNSGGALVNLNGDLIGINTAILSRTGAYNGYGFAVPSNIVQKIIRDLKAYGSVQRAFLGADVTDIDARIQERAKLKSMNGVYVSSVAGYGPAQEAGIKVGDVILEFNQIPVNSKAEFDEQLSYYRPGERVSITFVRERNNQTINIRLTNTEGTLDILRSEAITTQKLGASFESIGKLERDRLNIKGGIRISNITNGYIRRMGLREGFIITHINKIETLTPTQCIDLLENLNGQISIEGFDTNGRKAYYTFYSY